MMDQNVQKWGSTEKNAIRRNPVLPRFVIQPYHKKEEEESIWQQK